MIIYDNASGQFVLLSKQTNETISLGATVRIGSDGFKTPGTMARMRFWLQHFCNSVIILDC